MPHPTTAFKLEWNSNSSLLNVDITWSSCCLPVRTRRWRTTWCLLTNEAFAIPCIQLRWRKSRRPRRWRGRRAWIPAPCPAQCHRIQSTWTWWTQSRSCGERSTRNCYFMTLWRTMQSSQDLLTSRRSLATRRCRSSCQRKQCTTGRWLQQSKMASDSRLCWEKPFGFAPLPVWSVFDSAWRCELSGCPKATQRRLVFSIVWKTFDEAELSAALSWPGVHMRTLFSLSVATNRWWTMNPVWWRSKSAKEFQTASTTWWKFCLERWLDRIFHIPLWRPNS